MMKVYALSGAIMPHLFFIIENICSSILNNLKYYNYEIMVNECFIKGSERRFYIQRYAA